MAVQNPSLFSRSLPGSAAKTDPEGAPKAARRQFTAAEKLRSLQEVDACTQPGQIGPLLRREGLYSSQLAMLRFTPGPVQPWEIPENCNLSWLPKH